MIYLEAGMLFALAYVSAAAVVAGARFFFRRWRLRRALAEFFD